MEDKNKKNEEEDKDNLNYGSLDLIGDLLLFGEGFI